MTLVFSEFSFILHLAHRLASLSKSLCRYSAAKSILLLTAHWPASSANCDFLVFFLFVMDVEKKKLKSQTPHPWVPRCMLGRPWGVCPSPQSSQKSGNHDTSNPCLTPSSTLGMDPGGRRPSHPWGQNQITPKSRLTCPARPPTPVPDFPPTALLMQ